MDLPPNEENEESIFRIWLAIPIEIRWVNLLRTDRILTWGSNLIHFSYYIKSFIIIKKQNS